MTHSGFKTAQKILNLRKKKNNNKDYRIKEKALLYRFSSSSISFDYILRTKYGIYLNKNNKNYLLYDYERYQRQNPSLVFFEEHSDEENKIIQHEIINYYNSRLSQLVCSRDKTHSNHSINLTKSRNHDRLQKLMV